MAFNQGAAGAGMMGAASLDASLVTGVGTRPGIDLQLVGPRPSTLLERMAARPYRPLDRWDVDLHAVRWHRVESAKARRAIQHAIEQGGRPDVLLVNSHAVSFGLGRVMATIPTLLHVDVLSWPWAEMGVWRPVHSWSRSMLTPSARAERRVLGAAAAVLAWTGWAEDQVRAQAPGARVIRWHPGLDTRVFRPAPRRGGVPKVVFIGGRWEAKGGPDLVAALAPRLGRDVELHVVTPEGVRAGPGVVVHRLDRADPALLDLVQQAAVLCLPTRADATPWVLLEAMACGTPVVSTAVGAIAELLDGGRAGLLVPPGDVAALRSAIDAVLDDGQLADRLSAEGLRVVRQRYDARQQGNVLVELLHELVAAR